MGILWKFTSPLGISVGAVIRLNYRIAVGRGRRLWVGWRRSEIGQERSFRALAAIDRATSTADIVVFKGAKSAQLLQAVKQPPLGLSSAGKFGATQSFSGSPHRYPERGHATSDALDRHPAAGARAMKP